MVKTISSRSTSRVSEQVDDQGMRDGKGVHTIRDSCYHKQEGAEKTWGGGRWQQTRQWQDKLPTSKIYTTWAYILSDRIVFCTARGGGKTAGSNAPGAFVVYKCEDWTRSAMPEGTQKRKLQSLRCPRTTLRFLSIN